MQGSDGSSPHTPNVIDAVVKEAIFYLNSKHGVAKLGAVGICLRAKPTLVIGIITHRPSIFAAENDSIFTTEKRHESEQLLSKKGPKVPYQLCLYSSTSHGFAVRCDLSIPGQKYAKEQAFSQAISWFGEYLLRRASVQLDLSCNASGYTVLRDK
ncbi:unnamed protein product [Penicillium viridicatum]